MKQLAEVVTVGEAYVSGAYQPGRRRQRISSVRLADVPPLVKFLAALGHSTSTAAIASRLDWIQLRNDNRLWAATDPDGCPTGMVTAHLVQPSGPGRPHVEVTSLLVSAAHHPGRTAHDLIATAETWAIGRKAASVNLPPSLRPGASGAFYESVGYTHTGTRFWKGLRCG
ncbi:GNAT family N-acetyltransferase [Plantibacter sp. YIM 135249]|uniref:GNAT family N-acetyltransferase n=1 Tax=Plantibacter sp. YIM 135249 TaxID=3423918 RepID=UPI003D33A9AE